MEEHVYECREKAYYVPAHDDPLVMGWMLEFADMMSTGRDQFCFCSCRRIGCLTVARPLDWLNNEIGGGH